MHIRTVLNIIAILLLILDGFLLACGALAYYYGEYLSMRGFLFAAIGSGGAAGIILALTRKKVKQTLSPRDGFMFVTLSWITASAVGALPFWISGAIPGYADAFFETMSGFSTTGASILTNIEAMPKSLLFWRSLTHWLGGMGIVVLAVAILPLLGIGGMQLMRAEAPGPSVDKITPRIAVTAKYLWLIYIGFTVIETVLLMFGGMDLYESLTHAFGTVATGGFSTKNLSIKHFDSAYIDWVVTLFMVLAGINFTLHFRLLMGNLGELRKNTELKAYLAIFIAASIAISIGLYGKVYEDYSESLRYAAFQAASFVTTTGYATDNYENWPIFAQMILFMLMFVGGCAGSTGGGIKVIRIVTLLKQGLNEMKFLIHPRGVFILRLSGYPVRKNIVYAISGFFYLYIFLLLVVMLIVSTSGADLTTSITTALATVGNIGPGFGLVGPVDNYAFYPDYVKWVLSFAMLVGRLELYTVLVLFTPMFWRK
ncbi:TrkH family potassium uptake protein [Limisalsivibrio acetivorans]|uniref:TrkH family potassium uptake protein n=1 Tax=Limisalsivibrio acetivorans TaxID=1304888 RepID=UPI0003B67FAC|nr:potassium transporter TrkG [Limisalsivibrio acetivorans]